PHRRLPGPLLGAAVLREGARVLEHGVAGPLGVPARLHRRGARAASRKRLGARPDAHGLLLPQRELLVPPAVAARGGAAQLAPARRVPGAGHSDRYVESDARGRAVAQRADLPAL